MPSYRFCRPDDVPLLVEAVNWCTVQDAPAMTIEDYKRQMRVLNLWPSSCMIALEGREPVGVLLGCKRKAANFISHIVVHPAHRRCGHARHFLTSLSSKLAVLGPPTMLAEIAQGDAVARQLLQTLGYQPRAQLVSFAGEVSNRTALVEEERDCIGEITLAELEENGLLHERECAAWQRQLETLRNWGEELLGLAFASPQAIEGYLLYRLLDNESAEILKLHVAAPRAERLVYAVLLRELGNRGVRGVRIPRVGGDEVSGDCLTQLGYREQERVEIWQCVARGE